MASYNLIIIHIDPFSYFIKYYAFYDNI